MSDSIFQDMLLVIYKLGSLAVGFGSIYLGYRLFVKGVFGNAGTFKQKTKGKLPSEAEFTNELSLVNAAPGSFFALFGSIIIAVTLFKGIKLSDIATRYYKPIVNEELAHTSSASEISKATKLDGIIQHIESIEIKVNRLVSNLSVEKELEKSVDHSVQNENDVVSNRLNQFNEAKLDSLENQLELLEIRVKSISSLQKGTESNNNSYNGTYSNLFDRSTILGLGQKQSIEFVEVIVKGGNGFIGDKFDDEVVFNPILTTVQNRDYRSFDLDGYTFKPVLGFDQFNEATFWIHGFGSRSVNYFSNGNYFTPNVKAPGISIRGY